MRKGEIDIGENVVKKIILKRKFDKISSKTVIESHEIHARKHPLQKICIKLFNKYKNYMRLNSNSYFDTLTIKEIKDKLILIGEHFESSDISELRNQLKKFERTRNLQLWQNASSISNHGHILFCVNILYDPAVFLTSSEYEIKFKVKQSKKLLKLLNFT